MNFSKLFAFSVTVVLASGSWVQADDKPILLQKLGEQSFVMLSIAKQEVDFDSPWKLEPVRNIKHFGVVVHLPFTKELAVLVTASAVNNATRIEMLRFGQSSRREMKIFFVDYEANLALLKPENPKSLEYLKPIEVVPQIGLNEPIYLFWTKDSIQLSLQKGSLSAITFLRPSTSSYPIATYLVKIQQKIVGSSEPILFQNKLAALAIGQDSEHVMAIPGMIIKHFLEDALNESYRGFPSLGFATKPLTSPVMRKAINAELVSHGVRISQVDNLSPFIDKITENDLLLAIDNIKISDQGTIIHPLWGEVPYGVLLNQRFSKDLVTLDVLSKGSMKKHKAKLIRFNSNEYMIPYYRVAEKEPFIIFGGIVFQELSLDYLKSWGSDWQQSAQSDLLYAWYYQNIIPKQEHPRMIILNKVLADEFNRGYETLNDMIVEDINGERVTSLKDVTRALQKPLKAQDETFAKIKFHKGEGEIILGYKGLQKAHKRLAKNYGISIENAFFEPVDLP